MLSIYRLLGRLPLRVLYAVSSVMFLLVYFGLRYRRRTVAQNLAAAFPDLSNRERERLARQFYRHLCDVGVEVLASVALTDAQLHERLVFENLEVLQPFIERRQSLLILSSHQGNWEWLTRGMSLALPCPMDGIYKPLHNRTFDDFVQGSRGQSMNPIAFKNAGREMLRRRHEFRAFAMLADQAPFKRDKRYWSEFLGRPASFYLGPQKLAEATQYPVFWVSMTKLRRGYYRARIELLAEAPIAKGGYVILERYVAALETAIRGQPWTWLWSNRKWKHIAPANWQETQNGAAQGLSDEKL